MPKKHSPLSASSPTAFRHVFWLTWKLVIVLAAFLCFFALFKLHVSSSSFSSFRARQSRIRQTHFLGPPKISFLFLCRFSLPLDFFWHNFFLNADAAEYSIYVHSMPGFLLDESTTRSHFFYGRQLNNSIKVSWGQSSMIEAERLLFEAALQDPANQRFVLLSDSCIPLYNFSFTYNYIMASSMSFVDSFVDVEEGRYNPKMSPVIPKGKWRKGSQWITIIRRHAEIMVDDDVVLRVFKKFCKRRPPVDAKKGKLNDILQKQHNCIPDEHYVQTLFAMSKLEGECERRTLTYSEWNQTATKMEDKSWHPVTFNYDDSSPQHMKEIMDINNVYYETEDRREWCRTNSTYAPCFLFARKFSRAAAMRLLQGAVTPLDTSP